MQEPNLLQILNQLRQSDAHKTAFGTNWAQGRTAFGGLSTALAACAMAKLATPSQSIRSLMVSFVAPVSPGEVSVSPRIVRQGKSVTQMAAELVSDGQVCLHAMAAFGSSRETLIVKPDPGFKPSQRDTSLWKTRNNTAPSFLQYFEGSWSGGGIPFTGTKENHLGMWVRHKSELSEFPLEKLITVADIPPPVVLSHYLEPNVLASSLSWSLEFVKPPESIESDWFYLDFVIDHAANGYTQQSGKIFNESGDLCALSRQCMVYFEPRT